MGKIDEKKIRGRVRPWKIYEYQVRLKVKK